jgi:hypothetical protein
VRTGTLSLLGARHVPAPATITTGTLSLLGARHVPPTATITTATLSLTGINAPAAAPVNSPVGATPKPMTSQKPHSP